MKSAVPAHLNVHHIIEQHPVLNLRPLGERRVAHELERILRPWDCPLREDDTKHDANLCHERGWEALQFRVEQRQISEELGNQSCRRVAVLVPCNAEVARNEPEERRDMQVETDLAEDFLLLRDNVTRREGVSSSEISGSLRSDICILFGIVLLVILLADL